MQTTDTSTGDVTQLGRLGTELETLGFTATVYTHADRLAYLDVRNPRADILSERVYLQNGSFYWSWAEKITHAEDVTRAAAAVANVLRAVHGE